MGLKRKQMLMAQKAFFEQKLENRKSFLTEKKIEARQADKDTLVRKFQANIKAVNRRIKLIDNDAKITEDMKKSRAEKAAAAAAPEKKPAEAKAEKPKKAPVEGKEKKAKPEKKAASPKASEGDKS